MSTGEAEVIVSTQRKKKQKQKREKAIDKQARTKDLFSDST